MKLKLSRSRLLLGEIFRKKLHFSLVAIKFVRVAWEDVSRDLQTIKCFLQPHNNIQQL